MQTQLFVQSLPMKCLMLLCCLMAASVTALARPLTFPPSDEMAYQYTKFDGMPVWLVLKKSTGSVYLKVEKKEPENGRIANFLAREAKRLCEEKNVVISTLYKPQIMFKFLGGQPIWGPYASVQSDPEYTGFYFAKDATVKDGVIQAKGRSFPSIIDAYYWWSATRNASEK